MKSLVVGKATVEGGHHLTPWGDAQLRMVHRFPPAASFLTLSSVADGYGSNSGFTSVSAGWREALTAVGIFRNQLLPLHTGLIEAGDTPTLTGFGRWTVDQLQAESQTLSEEHLPSVLRQLPVVEREKD